MRLPKQVLTYPFKTGRSHWISHCAKTHIRPLTRKRWFSVPCLHPNGRRIARTDPLGPQSPRSTPLITAIISKDVNRGSCAPIAMFTLNNVSTVSLSDGNDILLAILDDQWHVPSLKWPSQLSQIGPLGTTSIVDCGVLLNFVVYWVPRIEQLLRSRNNVRVESLVQGKGVPGCDLCASRRCWCRNRERHCQFWWWASERHWVQAGTIYPMRNELKLFWWGSRNLEESSQDGQLRLTLSLLSEFLAPCQQPTPRLYPQLDLQQLSGHGSQELSSAFALSVVDGLELTL